MKSASYLALGVLAMLAAAAVSSFAQDSMWDFVYNGDKLPQQIIEEGGTGWRPRTDEINGRPKYESIVASPEALRIEFLMIGTSHDFAKRGGPGPYKFAPALDALRKASLPALRRLSLGDMEQLFNGNVYYGSLGDITHVFAIAPQLEELAICGCADLERPVTHEHLETLYVRIDDIGVSGGPLRQATIDHILMSRMPALRSLELSLDAEDVQPYDVPETFFSDNGFPALECFGMDCLRPESEARLRAWAEARKIRWMP